MKTSKDIEIVTSTASNKIWRLLRTNSSAVHLHVLILRDTPLGQISGTLQCSTVVSDIFAIVKVLSYEDTGCYKNSEFIVFSNTQILMLKYTISAILASLYEISFRHTSWFFSHRFWVLFSIIIINPIIICVGDFVRSFIMSSVT